MQQHQRQVGRRNPAHPSRLGQRPRPDRLQPLPRLGAQVAHTRPIEPLRNRSAPLPLAALDLLPLKRKIAGVTNVPLDLVG